MGSNKKTVQLLEQLNCKMDELIDLSKKNAFINTNHCANVYTIAEKLNQSLQSALDKTEYKND